MPRIEVFLTTTMEISHFAPIVRALLSLGADAQFISPQIHPKTRAYGWDDADRTEALLTQMGFSFVKVGDWSADAVLTIQGTLIPFISNYRGLKFRMTYGVGLVPPSEQRPMSAAFDYHLVHGPFNQRVQFQYHSMPSPNLPPERVKVIGYPRFDEWFERTNWDVARGELKLPRPTKPVLLWLPTWGASSSIDRFADAIFTLSDKYDIWVKPHHGTVTWERERMTKLAQGPCRIVDFTDPPEPSFAAASIVLADLASGAFSEAVFLGKKVVGLSTADEFNRILFDEVRCIIPICYLPRVLDEQIDGALGPPRRRQENIDHIRRYLVDSTEGADGMRAAKIILDCIDRHGPVTT